jgi:hypothetical protein
VLITTINPVIYVKVRLTLLASQKKCPEVRSELSFCRSVHSVPIELHGNYAFFCTTNFEYIVRALRQCYYRTILPRLLKRLLDLKSGQCR